MTTKNLAHPNPERHVSLRPSTFVRPQRQARGDLVDDLTRYENTAERGDTIRLYGCPGHLRHVLDLFRKSGPRPRSLEDALAFCLERGSQTLIDIPEIRTIQEARAVVQRSLDERIQRFAGWTFTLQRYHLDPCELHGRLVAEARDRLGVIADTLGLRKGVIAALGLETVLLQVPTLPDLARQRMAEEVKDFHTRVTRRAEELVELSQSVQPAEVTGRPIA